MPPEGLIFALSSIIAVAAALTCFVLCVAVVAGLINWAIGIGLALSMSILAHGLGP